ncbi:MAG: VanZ family protein [Pseudomonadota bacterium]
MKDFSVETIRLLIRRAAWLSILIVLLVTLVPIGWRPASGLAPNIERFCVMAAVGALFAAAYPRRFWLIVLALSLAAAIFEPLQYIAAGRHPSFRDVEFKSLGAAIGAVVGYAVASVTGLMENPPHPAPEAT